MAQNDQSSGAPTWRKMLMCTRPCRVRLIEVQFSPEPPNETMMRTKDMKINWFVFALPLEAMSLLLVNQYRIYQRCTWWVPCLKTKRRKKNVTHSRMITCRRENDCRVLMRILSNKLSKRQWNTFQSVKEKNAKWIRRCYMRARR